MKKKSLFVGEETEKKKGKKICSIICSHFCNVYFPYPRVKLKDLKKIAKIMVLDLEIECFNLGVIEYDIHYRIDLNSFFFNTPLTSPIWKGRVTVQVMFFFFKWLFCLSLGQLNEEERSQSYIFKQIWGFYISALNLGI